MRFNKLILGFVVTAGLSFTFSNINVNAATWHKGTPKVLRGKYKSHKYGADLMSTLNITKTKMIYWTSGIPVQNGYNLSYKITDNHKYVLRYSIKSSGILHGGKNLKFTMKKIGKNIKIGNDSHLLYKY